MNLIGRTLSQYHIIEQLGQGGMATVYKAYQPALERHVAIKVLSPQQALMPGFSERFVREARTVAQLNHPNILPVMDYGQEGKLSYIVMKLVTGGTLRDRLNQPMDLAETARIVEQIAAALDHAHGRGILHRDIKPSNVLLDEGDWVQLADFGLARMLASDKRLTTTGAGIGTPAYVSPEQVQGRPVDHRTDVYSLGVTLYEMSTGRLPYEADDPLALIVKHLMEAPLPPRQVNPTIPAMAEAVILKAMAKQPDDRYASAGEMAHALQQAIAQQAQAGGASPISLSPEPVAMPSADVQAALGEPPHPQVRRNVFRRPTPAGAEYGRSASEGLVALAELMQAPRVRAAVVAFRTDFEAAREQIDVLGSYKQLHDLLHALQFHCYNPIVQEARFLQDDDVAVDNLMDHELTLQRIISDLGDVTERASFATTDTLWIQDLVKAREALGEALEELDQKPLKRAIWLLNRVLSVQPSRINTRLNATARALRLPVLVEAMMRVRHSLARLDLDSDKVEQLEAGVDALVSLSHSLTTLVDDHDRWQAVDIELRRIEGNMGRDTTELEMSWPDLKAMTEPLYGGRTDEWAISFRKDSEHLEGAIAARNPTRIRRYFRRYCRQTGIRFHRVDLDLKRLCEDLRRTGEPLASVMRMIA